MKKKTTTAILLATTMMLALMGCGAASESSSDAKAPVAEINEKADSNSADTDKEEKDDTDIDADAETSTESATPADSAAIAESAIEYKGEKFSALDDLQASLDKAGSVAELAPGYPQEVGIDSGNFAYMYDATNEEKGECGLYIATYPKKDGQGLWTISSSDSAAKTSKGIHPGSTEAEVTEAYGKPTRKDDEYNFSVYDFGNYILTFSINNGVVTRVQTENANLQY